MHRSTPSVWQPAAGLMLLAVLPAAAALHLDELYQRVQVDIAAYETGEDFKRDRQLYINQYYNNEFWASFWERPSTDAGWAQQARMLIIHASNAIEHLQASLEFFKGYTLFAWGDGQPLTIRRQFNYTNYRTYYYEAILNNQVILRYNGLWTGSAGWQNFCQQLAELWINSNPDPNGALFTQDYNIIQYTVFNASEYQLATGGSGQPDSSYLSLWQDAQQGGDQEVKLPEHMAGTFYATHDQIYEAMLQAGVIVNRPPQAPLSDAIIQIRNIYTQNSPVQKRRQLLTMLFDMFINTGYWNGNVFSWRAIVYSTAYQMAYQDYKNICDQLIAQYTSVINQLKARLETAYQEDRRILAYIDAYREDRRQQRPLASAISEAQARTLFLQQVGDMSLKNIPYISIAAYTPWIAGPPWSETPCFPSPWGCTPNPLYHTIVAQLIRGLDRCGGVVLMPQNAAYNEMKNQMQQDVAVQTIMDLANKTEELNRKQSWLQQLSTNKVFFWGDRSHTRPVQVEPPATPPPPKLLLQQAHLQNTVSALEQLRQSPSTLVQPELAAEAGEQGTLLERSALRTRQEAAKLSAVQELNEAYNQRAVMRAQENLRQHQQAEERRRQQRPLHLNQPE